MRPRPVIARNEAIHRPSHNNLGSMEITAVNAELAEPAAEILKPPGHQIAHRAVACRPLWLALALPQAPDGQQARVEQVAALALAQGAADDDID